MSYVNISGKVNIESDSVRYSKDSIESDYT